MQKLKKNPIQQLVRGVKDWKRRRQEEKITKLQIVLEKLLKKLLGKGEISPSFLDFVRSIEGKNEQKMAWERVFSRKDLDPMNLYGVAIVIPEEYQEIRDKVIERFLKESDGNELHHAVKEGSKDISDRSFNELYWRIERVRKGFIKKGRAIEILMDLLKDFIRDKKTELCQKVLQLLKTLDPPADKLREISLLSSISSVPEVEREIVRFLREKHEKDGNTKLIKKIRTLKAEVSTFREALIKGQ